MPDTARGFTLTELAVVLAIVGLLLGSLMYTLSAQVDQRDFEETRRRLDQARELLLSYAIVNGRLPCPARYASSASNSAGLESFCAAASPATCSGSETTTKPVSPEHGNCSNYYDGYIPAASLGISGPVDSTGFAVDGWGNRIRYAVAKLNTNCSTSPPANTILYTSAVNLKTYGISCQPNDLLVCKSATGITSTDCGGAANQIMSQSLVAAIIFSTGKNATSSGASAVAGLDEAANLNGDRVFVSHTPSPSAATNGEFDDQFTWITVGELYGKLISAGVLP
jgi:prepilin-type N-terminal cleavage/methylation domain-containing protein